MYYSGFELIIFIALYTSKKFSAHGMCLHLIKKSSFIPGPDETFAVALSLLKLSYRDYNDPANAHH